MSRYADMAVQYNASPQLWVHGEDVYLNGAVTAIKAIVVRDPVGPPAEAPGSLRQPREVWVSKADLTSPIPGTTTINFAFTKGDSTTMPTVPPTVKAVIGQAAGMWHLRMT